MNQCAELARVRILVVDDDEFTRTGLAKLLEYEGFQVVTSHDGVDALTHLRRKEPFGLVISDIEMPLLNGIELLARVRAETNTPIVLMSARDPANIAWPSEDRADGFFPKPFTFDDALPVILRALRVHDRQPLTREPVVSEQR